ncbi:MAG: orange carotenoid protein, partial [Microcoleus sp. SIO2G3]|nr:orange carotenoid protein [Microcoleus sp. SIO2G3]
MKADNLAAMPDETKKAVEAFKKLGTDDKLALFYLIYTKMGDSVTPAAPSATDPELTPKLMGEFFELSDD